MEAAAYIPTTWTLPDAVRRRLGATIGQQRLIDVDGNLLLLLHEPPRPEDAETRHGVVFWCDTEGQWLSAPRDGGLIELERHLQRYRQAIHGLDRELAEARTARQFYDVIRHTHSLQRATLSQVHVMQAAREARPAITRLISLRDQATDLERAIALIAANARVGMDFSLADNAAQQLKITNLATLEARRLNRLVAFFLPIGTLVSVFGMNNALELFAQNAFWWIMLVGLFMGVSVYYVVTGRSRE